MQYALAAKSVATPPIAGTYCRMGHKSKTQIFVHIFSKYRWILLFQVIP